MVVDKKKSLMLAIIVIVLFLIIALLTIFPRQGAVVGEAVFTKDVNKGIVQTKEMITLDNADVFYYDVVYSASAEKYTLNFYSDVAGVVVLNTVSLGEGESGEVDLNGNKVNLVIKNSKLAIKTGLDIGLVAHWDFDSGSLKDSVSGVVATNNGAVTASGYDGKGAYSFDGKTTVIKPVVSNLPADASPRTVSAWIYPTADSRGMIVSYGYNGDNKKFDFEINGWASGLKGKLIIHVWNAGIATIGTPIKLNEWQHVALTYNTGTLQNGVKLYVNGLEVDTENANFGTTNDWTVTPITVASNLQIGMRSGGDGPFSGKIDEVRIYDRALSGSEVKELAKKPSDPLVCTPACGLNQNCFSGQCVDLDVCGDGSVGVSEQCDDGNTASGDGCSVSCEVEVGYECILAGDACMLLCGNAVLNVDEICDDGNVGSGDGCSVSCEVEAGYECLLEGDACNLLCGNNKLDGVEFCDDGNTADGDGCSVSCEVEAGWSCQSNICEPIVTCGNGQLDGVEVCDDSNTFDNDGCSADCGAEDPTYSCEVGKLCVLKCGNGILNIGEQCDYAIPGNLAGFGCTQSCTAEQGFTCDAKTGVCLAVNKDSDADGVFDSQDSCNSELGEIVMANGCMIGDVDESGCVDDKDLNKLNAIFGTNFGKCNSYSVSDGDINGDGCVNDKDLVLLKENFVTQYASCKLII